MNTKDDKKQNTSVQRSAFIGTLAGLAETFLLHPLWILKTRSQCKYPFTLNPFVLYKGVTFSTATSVVTSIFQVGSTVSMSEKLDSSYRSRFTQQAMTFSALTSGVAIGFLSTPIDVILVQQQKVVDVSSVKQKNDFLSIASKIKLSPGFRAFFCGAPITSLQFALYNYGVFVAAPWIGRKIDHNLNNNTRSTFIGGILSGTVLTVITQPLDTVARLQQDQTMQKMRLTAYEHAKKLYKEHGGKGFYRGISWRAAQTVIAATSTGTIIETLRPTF